MAADGIPDTRRQPVADVPNASVRDIFAGDGEMRIRCRAVDWSATPLGPVKGWPVSLRTTVSVVLAAPIGMILLWGPELVQIYNDHYRDVMGDKHPGGLGQRNVECWPEVWDFTGPIYEGVLERGESFTFTDQPLVLKRHGAPDEGFFTLSYTPVPRDDGRVGGILVTVVETTANVRQRREREGALLHANELLQDQAAELEAQTEELRTVAERLEERTVAAEESEAALRVMDARLRFAMEVAELGAWDLDFTGDASWRALRHDQIFGYPEGRDMWSFEDFLSHVHPDDRDEIRKRYASSRAGNGTWDFSCRIRRAGDGEERWVAVRGDIVTGRDGRAERMIGVVRDVTDQVHARQDIERLLQTAEAARAEAVSANRAKGEFLAVMSHELRTPLNAIDGYAELMELGIRGPLTAEQRQDLGRIRKSQKSLLGLINGVLNYARVEAGAVHYEMETVVVEEVLATCEALTLPQVHAKGLGLTREPALSSLAVHADREKLQQVVLNLLSNAIKFTSAGGTITLRCAPAEVDGAPMVRIMVRDTGIGIAPNQLARVFEPFVQVDSELTRTRDGAGLGLAISRDLARGMGGDLTAESALGGGSSFLLTLQAG